MGPTEGVRGVTGADGKLSFKETLKVAVVTAAMTLFGGIIVTGYTNSGQRELANEQFQKTQRANAYSTFVGATEDLLRAERNASQLFEPRQDIPTQAEGQSRIDTLGDINVKLQTAAAVVAIVGPTEVAVKSDAVVKKMEELSGVYFRGFGGLYPPVTREALAAVKAQGDPLYADYYRLKKDFLDATQPAYKG
jgi:K+/H+ antiporter YhaU regulatory subunit KhtT